MCLSAGGSEGEAFVTPQESDSEDLGWEGARVTISAGSRSLPTPFTVDTFQALDRIWVVMDLGRTVNFSASPTAFT